MNEALKGLFTRLAAEGIRVDERRMIASFKLAADIAPAADGNTDSSDALQEDDLYLYVTFRALSAAAFPWKDLYLDFSKEGVLKKAVKLLKGLTVYSNHDARVENWKGVVVESRWDAPDSIPPGINARLRINKKWNEKEVDGIKEGAIHSSSLDVMFLYEKSHPDLADFWFHMGEEINGSIVRLIVAKIISCGELSLVWQGADGYAKQAGFSLPTSLSTGDGDSGSMTGEHIRGGNEVKVSRHIIVMLGLALADYGFGRDAKDVDLDEAGQARFMGDLARSFAELKNEKESLAGALDALLGEGCTGDDLKARTAELKKLAADGEAYLADTRNEALRLAKVAEGTDALSSPMEKAILGAPLEDAKKFADEFRVKAEAKFPAKCQACGAALSRGSAGRTAGEEGGAEIDMRNYEM